MKLPLKGIIPPIITPLTDNNTLDVQGLENLINHVIKGGVHGLFILGTTGEATSLTYGLRKEMMLRTCNLVNGKVPVVVGITDTSLAGTMEIAEYASNIGIDAVVLAPPYYFPMSQEEMQSYLEDLTPMLPLPFLMYDIPGCTKIHMSIETVKKAKELGAIGIKDSSGDMAYLLNLIREFRDSPEFSIIAGTELFLPDTILNGGHGSIAGGANIFPELFVDLYGAAVRRDIDEIGRLREKVMLINNTIFSIVDYDSRIIKGIKCALNAKGICSDYMAMPLRKFSDNERMKVRQYVAELEKIINSD